MIPLNENDNLMIITTLNDIWKTLWEKCSLIHLMRAIARADASTLATNLMRVNSTHYFCL